MLKQNFVGRDIGLLIQKARNAKNLKQKDVATNEMDSSVYQKHEKWYSSSKRQILLN